jgi:hypothetical protein
VPVYLRPRDPLPGIRESTKVPGWCYNAAINENDWVKIGYGNARRLIRGLADRLGRPVATARM